ncbi:basic membrane lipoprotein Med (substrate-binding protein (PBP1-ABC) superfamily) [Aminobacter niigataensis]|uniref:Basic membrane lipoprotein Med (Substrate-binding protein (PBP1-ABC) superfamily) n=1 Tax=Aminobacter niigataensis TaxID=83265 RepID=A0ABR6KZF8_9HYPH|nr:BMP family protein [Aminobacter niigataensis]MBB4649929.1 basic membrane lipoprotein Med (substrate-binding protein (PBP1-ABC) superfamily) [Aminobacter niigataensis]
MLGQLSRRLLAIWVLTLFVVFGHTNGTYAGSPEKLRIAVILSAGLDHGFDATLIKSLERVKQAKPHGLDIEWKSTEPLWGDDAGDAMRLFAESGDYDIIWAHSTYSDQVKKLKDEFPEILFVVVGAGNEGLGDNQYWVYKRLHEPAYLLGVLAGRMTKSDVLGVVAPFFIEDINDSINAFFAGARAVNPAIARKVAFVGSWYDPAKAAEYAGAQIAAGADVIFQLSGNFKPCEAAKILCFGSFQDESNFSPATILSSTVAVWDPDLMWIIENWWSHKAEGKPYGGNLKEHWFGMKDGGAAFAPYHDLEASLPVDVRTEVETLKAKIASGELEIPVDLSEPKSD